MFNFEDANVRVINRNEEPWFVAKDVCDVLGFKYASDATKYLDEEEKALINNPSFTSNPNGDVSIINESGLYSLILRSRKPNAKKFKRWVTGEVLPSIRKHGAYATPDVVEKALSDPDSMIKVLTALKQERKEKENLIPKAAHSDSLCDSESLFTTTQIAKRLGTGAQSLNKFLISKGILRQDKMPAFKIQNRNGELFKIVVHKISEDKTTQYIKWFEAGARYITSLWQRDDLLLA
ncbi:MAG: phage antirepressor [Lentisphaerae bacterium]|nr:phage antirepressor [Lentisphaerota bacterium]MCP4100434.1 phage antirepressor [Lentisphaerota bacterium]